MKKDRNFFLGHSRLAEEREKIWTTQQQAADFFGVSRVTWGQCERGNATPSGDVLAGLAQQGADVLYILTGQHTLLDNHARTEPLSDRARLQAAIEAVEEGLSETRRRLHPAKKAELVLAAYDLMAGPDASRDNVIRLVRLAA